MAGLFAALAAHEFGLKPIVLEKGPHVGGGTTNSDGVVWVGANHLADAAGIEDTQASALEYCRFMAGGEAIQDNLDTFVTIAPEALRFFEKCGIEFRIIHGLPDHYHGIAPQSLSEGRCLEVELISEDDLPEPRPPLRVPAAAAATPVMTEEIIAWGGPNNRNAWDKEEIARRTDAKIRTRGTGLIAHLMKALLQRNVPILTDVAVSRLIVADGAVCGVVSTLGDEYTARAGVVLAAGGYESNGRLVDQFEGVPHWKSFCPPEITGDGLVMASDIGAAVHLLRDNMQVFLGFEIPGKTAIKDDPAFHLTGIVELFSPHTMVVNKSGERFADESFFQRMIPELKRFDPMLHDYPNLPCFLIFDQQYADQFGFAGGDAGAEIPDWVHRADTLTDLAHLLGVAPEGLANTVERFNSFAESGVDGDYGRGDLAWRIDNQMAREGFNPSLGAILKPPFYGLQLSVTGASSAGLLCDNAGCVINNRSERIPGLYATGNTAAKTELGAGYQAGFSLASGMTFGYLSAKHMAESRVP
jgi:3-oxosteroid 1-dehydrogenase